MFNRKIVGGMYTTFLTIISKEFEMIYKIKIF